jgi:hypothetical protein
MLKTRKKLFLMILISNIILAIGTVVAYGLYTDTSSQSCADSGGSNTCVTGYSNHAWSSASGEGQCYASYSDNLKHNGVLLDTTANTWTVNSPYVDSFGILIIKHTTGVSGGHYSNGSHNSTLMQIFSPYGRVDSRKNSSCYRDTD